MDVAEMGAAHPAAAAPMHDPHGNGKQPHN